MTPSDAKFAELAELLAQAVRQPDGRLPLGGSWSHCCVGDPDAQDFYWRILVVDSDLQVAHLASRCPCRCRLGWTRKTGRRPTKAQQRHVARGTGGRPSAAAAGPPPFAR